MKKVFLLLALVLGYGCSDDSPVSPKEDPKPARPRIVSVSPSSARTGQAIVITGSNFSDNRDSLSVAFGNDVFASIDSCTSATIFTHVPAGAKSGKIFVRKGNVSDSADFTLIGRLELLDFSPKADSIGRLVKIFFTEYKPGQGETKVFFGDKEAIVAGSGSNEISAIVPQGALSGFITVIHNGDTAVSKERFTVRTQSPVITSFSPQKSIVRSELVIRGYKFGNSIKDAEVFFGPDKAEIISLNDSVIRVRVPRGAITRKISVKLKNETGTSADDHTLIPKTDFSSCRVQLSHVMISVHYTDTTSTVAAHKGEETFIIDTISDREFDVEFFADRNLASQTPGEVVLERIRTNYPPETQRISFTIDENLSILSDIRCSMVRNEDQTLIKNSIEISKVDKLKETDQVTALVSGKAVGAILKDFDYFYDWFDIKKEYIKPRRMIKSISIKSTDNAILTITLTP